MKLNTNTAAKAMHYSSFANHYQMKEEEKKPKSTEKKILAAVYCEQKRKLSSRRTVE